ncbi:hypothetical protein [Streptomyces sp. NPDC058683]|uniref:hypothetical protein n=1 Tax=Streptomyces sp. NPDC058683 TaxID=3346597 RepID=UPI00365E0D6E
MTSHTRVVVIGAGLGAHPEDRERDGCEPRSREPRSRERHSRDPHHRRATGEAEVRPGDVVVPLAVAAPGAFTHDGGS